MVKSYLGYKLGGILGVIATSGANVVYSQCGNFVYVPCLEYVGVWHLRRAQRECMLLEEPKDRSESLPLVSALCCLSKGQLAAGYTDGRVRIWDIDSRECTLEFHGHRAPVRSLALPSYQVDRSLHDQSQNLLAPTHLLSCGQDGQLVFWDLLSESGICRLRGHTDAIHCAALWIPSLEANTTHTTSENEKEEETTSHMSLSGAMAYSASRDGSVRVWQLGTQHCAQIIPHRQSVGAILLCKKGTRLLTTDAAGILRVFQLLTGEDAKKAAQAKGHSGVEASLGSVYADPLPGGAEVRRSATGRGLQLELSVSGVAAGVPELDIETRFVALVSADRLVEIFLLHPTKIAEKRRRTRIAKAKRKRAKQKSVSQKNQIEAMSRLTDPEKEISEEFAANDEMNSALVIRCAQKIRSVKFSPSGLELLVHLHNNRLDVYKLSWQGKHVVAEKQLRVEREGHAHAIRTLAQSSDDGTILTACRSSLRFFHAVSGRCIHHISVPQLYPLASLFVPGDRHVVVASRDGSLGVYSVQNASLHQGIEEAHEGAIWALAPQPDRRGFLSGGVDGYVKSWKYELQVTPGLDGKSSRKSLVVAANGEFKVEDEILALCAGAESEEALRERGVPDEKRRAYIAVALMDCTVRVYHADTRKFYLKLYGHALPALALAFSDDATMLATGGSDKQIKLWGMDFGDCRRSLRSRGDAVTCLAFVPGTHYLWAGSKDGSLSMWDADTFEQVQRLAAHHSELWCMSISSGGGSLVSGGADGSVRIWRRSQEQLFLEEQRELGMDRQLERDMERQQQKAQDETEGAVGQGAAGSATGEGNSDDDDDDDDDDAESEMHEAQVTTAGRVSLHSIKAGERLLEALQKAFPLHQVEMARKKTMALEEEIANENPKKRARTGEAESNQMELPVEFGGKSPQEHVLKVLSGIRSAELEAALLVLPLAAVLHLLEFIRCWLSKNLHPALSCRVLLFLVRTFQKQLSSTPTVAPLLIQLRDEARIAIQWQKDLLGKNQAALTFIQELL